jgi:tRNA-splicing ligase RtcB (3'-phosphate/5'-hydroxy nucleic acid ligase)
MGSWKLPDVARRIDATRIRIDNANGVPVTLFAKQELNIEPEAIEQLLGFVSLEGTLRAIETAEAAGRCAPFWGDAPGRLRAVVLTPDFHRGGGIPIGTVADAEHFVVPQAVGNDVCCGMRLLGTDVRRDELTPLLPRLQERLRALYFEGQRDIPMSPRQREALLRDGLPGLAETSCDNAGVGTWAYYEPAAQRRDLERAHFGGGLPARGLHAFGDFVRGSGARDSRDAQIGSVGGGNHFVELQVVDQLLDGATARLFGLERDRVAIMAHSGSVGLGHAVGGHFHDVARALHPRELPQPAHGFYVLPTSGPHAAKAAAYLDAMHNAANFAFGNRLFLGLMMVRALSELLGRRVEARLVYDAPHNLIWAQPGGARFLHRKGACPALGPEPDVDSPFRYTGQPVIIPGSMGAHSFVLAGAGNEEALASACHGAGRVLSRGETRHVGESAYVQATEQLRVVTPIDPNAYDVRSRRDVLAKYHDRLREEAPYAYKPITPVVETVEEAGIARRVARLWPLLTVKG